MPRLEVKLAERRTWCELCLEDAGLYVHAYLHLSVHVDEPDDEPDMPYVVEADLCGACLVSEAIFWRDTTRAHA